MIITIRARCDDVDVNVNDGHRKNNGYCDDADLDVDVDAMTMVF